MLSSLVLFVYGFSLFFLMLYGFHRYWILWLYYRFHKKKPNPLVSPISPELTQFPCVTVQIPLFNEMYVARRIISAVAEFDYPKKKLEIQILDDSHDQTSSIVSDQVSELQGLGFNIHHLRRSDRNGFKAGALAEGLLMASGEFIAIFDADFVPPSHFLRKVLPNFNDPCVGMVQTRWGHINSQYSLLTRMQALLLDGHFMLEHTARHKSGAFFNFNGTAGIWRREAINDAGGWRSTTLTEDLDLSYRAQLKGWKFIYLPDVVCPAELPVDIQSFRVQQERWTQGTIQVARLQLKSIWKAPIPFLTKLESTVHLTANIGYVLTALVSLLLLPSLLMRHQLGWGRINMVEVVAFVMMTGSVSIFYMVSQKEIYGNWFSKIKDLPLLMAFGIAMALSNSAAVFRGLFVRGGEFIRTPKFHIVNRKDSWMRKVYGGRNSWFVLIYILFALYSLVTGVIAILIKSWVTLPFILLFTLGFAYLSQLSFVNQISDGK